MSRKIPKPSKPEALIEKFHHIDLFDTSHFVVIGDHDLLHDWCSETLTKNRIVEFRNMLKPIDATTRGRMYPMAGGGSIIWLKPGEDLKYLVHEVTHAATHLLRDKGMPICDQTDELLCYLVERLYEHFA